MRKVGNIRFEYNDKFRIKVNQECNLACPFCHSEGTRETESVSLSDPVFLRWLPRLKAHFNKVHLTGGEPTLYADLPRLCRHLKKEGFEVLLTTNLLVINKNLLEAIPYLSKVNVSFHSFNPAYFESFIPNKKQSGAYIESIRKNILALKELIGNVSINTVVGNDSSQNLAEIAAFCRENRLLLKLVPDWRFITEGKNRIRSFLDDQGFKEIKRIIKIPGSNLRILYQKGETFIELKDIVPYYLDYLCNDCPFKQNCIETFAFLRLEGNPLRFKTCISKPAVDNNTFEEDIWPQFEKTIKSETNSVRMKSHQTKPLVSPPIWH